MNKHRFFLVGVYGLVLLGLSSCAGYQRNYTGAALPIEEVAFLFNDDSSVHGDLGLEGVVDKSARLNITTIPDAYGALDRLLGLWPYCRELLPGPYAVEAWKTTYEPFGGKERLDRESAGMVQDVESWDYGPYRVRFEAEAGHIYLLKSIYYNQEDAPAETGPWEIEIEDVSSDEKYQGYLKMILPERK